MFAAANFPLSSPKDKHEAMQILLKGKYHIYILDPQLDIISEIETGKKTKKQEETQDATFAAVTSDHQTAPRGLTSSWLHASRKGGNAQRKTVNRTLMSFP